MFTLPESAIYFTIKFSNILYTEIARLTLNTKDLAHYLRYLVSIVHISTCFSFIFFAFLHFFFIFSNNNVGNGETVYIYNKFNFIVFQDLTSI